MTIEREVHFRLISSKNGDSPAEGKTVNMSSSGVLFSTDQALLPGRHLELTISWPVQLDNKCPLKLVARGRVVRSQSGYVAFEIFQHEFRTKSSRAATTP